MPSGFSIFGLNIKFYGLLIACAFLLGIFLLGFFAKKKGYNKDLPYDLVLLIFPFAIIGARLYYILFSGRSWTFSEMLAINNGGLAIYGGIIGGIIAIAIYSKIKKIQVIKLLDLAVPALIIGQAIGRWGNFFNQEAFGPVVTNTSLQWFPYSVYIELEGLWHMATFFYESMWNFIGFFLLATVFIKTDKKGLVTSLYLMYYGLGRALIEGLRTDSLFVNIFNIDFRVSQLLSVGLIIIGIIMFICFNRKQNISKKVVKN